MAGGSVGAVAIIVFFIVLVIMKRKKRRDLAPKVETTAAEPPSVKSTPTIIPAPHAFSIPFDQITVGPVIASGGQGQIRKGDFSGKAVAIKELMQAMFNPNDTKELEKEATILSSLHHPNIVRFYGMSVDHSPSRGASYYLITELLDTDLRKFIDHECQPDPDDIFRIAIEICSPLEFLHARNMVHRDLKPENILLDANRTAFICDFGLSKSCHGRTSVDMTMNLGTAAYMAPELSDLKNFAMDFGADEEDFGLADKPDATILLAQKHGIQQDIEHVDFTKASPGAERSQNQGKASLVSPGSNKTLTTTATKIDCYSFSLVLWALLSWKLPFRNISPMQIMVAVACHNKRPPTRQIASKWNQAVIKLMRRMWQPTPSSRPTMAECKSELQAIRDNSSRDPDMAELEDDYGEDLCDDYGEDLNDDYNDPTETKKNNVDDIDPAPAAAAAKDDIQGKKTSDLSMATKGNTAKKNNVNDIDAAAAAAAATGPHEDPDMAELLDDYGEDLHDDYSELPEGGKNHVNDAAAKDDIQGRRTSAPAKKATPSV